MYETYVITLFGGFTGKKVLFVSGPRSAVIVLTVIGFAMCSLGNLGVFINKAPVHPLTIIGYLLGALALFIGIIQIFKFKLPLIGDPKYALIMIAVIIAVKFIVARLSYLLPVK